MKAFVKMTATSPEVEALEVPAPEVGEHELLIEIKAIGVGVHDEYFLPSDADYPYVVGIEAAGVIKQVGAGVEGREVGQSVAFVSAMQSKGGTWAEYAVVSDSALILDIPEDMSYEQAAALPVAGNTALKAMAGVDLNPEENLFIAGGAGAIGTLLIQIAVRRGYEVIASASAKNHEYMTDLGADDVVDYHDEDWQQQVCATIPEGVDGAIAIHPGTPLEVQPVVRDGGTLIAVSGDQFETERRIVLKQVFNDVDVSSELAELFSLVAEGQMTLPIEKVYPFADGLAALEKVKTRHNRGKIVITLATD